MPKKIELKEIILIHATNNGDYIPDYRFGPLQNAIEDYIADMAEKVIRDELSHEDAVYFCKTEAEQTRKNILIRIRKELELPTDDYE